MPTKPTLIATALAAAARSRTLEAALQEAQEPLLDASAPTTSAVDASESPDRAQQEE